jgi:hypothetical protein
MCRTALTTLVLAALAAWASGQTGPPPGETAGERMNQFARNRALVELLVTRGVDLADADDPLVRARVCYVAAGEIGGRLREAVAAGDPVRVAELAEYLAAVARDGLIPTLWDARRAIPAGTHDEETLVQLRDDAAAGLGQFAAAVPADGRFGTSARVQSARRHLTEARGALEQIK